MLKRIKMDSQPHALMLPFPAQGHVTPLMELAHYLVSRGFHITFINTEFNHNRIMNSLSMKKGNGIDRIHLVKVHDGLGPTDYRNYMRTLYECTYNIMLLFLEEIIQKNNDKGEKRFTCFIGDLAMPHTLERARRLGLKTIGFWTASPAVLASILGIQILIDDGIIDENGAVTKETMITQFKGMPPRSSTDLFWNCFKDPKDRDIIFKIMMKTNGLVNEYAEYIFCNSFQGINLPLIPCSTPKILSIGPLISNDQLAKQARGFWPEDSNYATWLDEQPDNSVIYAAFGSLADMTKRQFEDLALGLELTNQSFLWVVRSDFTENSNNTYPNGFLDRVKDRGRIVRWTNQRKVLAHPAVSCFVSHCGWNSTMEGARNGIRFLCWPCFADQSVNESYVCDEWKIGLRLVADDDGVVSREEIGMKVEKLLGDEDFEKRAAEMKTMAQRSADEGGRGERWLGLLDDENCQIKLKAIKMKIKPNQSN